MKCARFVLACLLLSLCIWACSSQSGQPGQLVLTVQTDMSVPKDVDTIRIEISTLGKVRFDRDFPVGHGKLLLPATLGILPGSDPSVPVRIRVISRQGAKLRTLREAVTTVPTDRVALLRMPIQWLCDGQAEELEPGKVESTCPEGQTCVSGACEPEDIDAESLPDYAAEAVFGGGTGQGDGDCFDTVACFADGSAVSVDRGDCTVPLPEGKNANYALVRPPGSAGICGRQACLVPLDAESSAGWQRVDGRAKLPGAVCDKLDTGDVVAVAVTTTCDSKTESIPTCGSWSSVTVQKATTDAAAPADVRLPGLDAGRGTVDRPDAGGPPDAASDAIADAMDPTSAEREITTEGGALRSADGVLMVTVPPGAFGRSFALTIRPTETTTPEQIGTAYDLGPDGMQFSAPIPLEYTYDERTLGSVDPLTLVLAYLDETGTWHPLADSSVDPSSGVVSATTDHFTPFGLIEQPCVDGEPCQTGLPGPCATGNVVCEADQGRCEPAAVDQPEICDGLDNNCDGQIDEGFDLATDPQHCGSCDSPCGAGASCVAGTCQPAPLTCQPGYTPCGPSCVDIQTDPNHCGQCNKACGSDAICSGGTCVLSCSPPLADCGGGGCIDTTSDPNNCGACGNVCSAPNAIMGCTAGTCQLVSCNTGYFDLDGMPGTGCEYSCTPTGSEICDGVDNDCNGIVDDSPTDAGTSCGSAIGACQTGVTQCVGGMLQCNGEVAPATETCNGIDDDCDGVVDDNEAQSECMTAYGTTPNTATVVCVQALCWITECVPGMDDINGDPADGCEAACTASTEVCDGLDNDCNGVKDDGLGGGQCGTSSVGECQLGTNVCERGSMVCQGEIQPSVEVCDGLDNDCDGVIDNNVDVGSPCGISMGVCQQGVTACVAGSVECQGSVDPTTEICGDSLDNDCDGQVDNGCP